MQGNGYGMEGIGFFLAMYAGEVFTHEKMWGWYNYTLLGKMWGFANNVVYRPSL